MFGQGTQRKIWQRAIHVDRERFKQAVPQNGCLRDLGVLKETLPDYIEENTVNRGCTDMNRHRDRQRQPKS